MNLHEGTVDYDIIVVGGGPGGCAFVRSLIDLKPDLRVLLIDKERFPRDKVCGDGLTYQAIPLVGKVFPELASLTPSAAFTARQILHYPFGQRLVREGQMLDVIPRLEFDNALWRATVAAGAETRENACVTGLLTSEGRVRGVRLREANGSSELTCKLLVGADGSRSLVRRETGSTDNDFVIHSLRQYVRGLPDSTEGLIFFFDIEHRGYFWIFPFVRNGERWANLGYGNSTDNRTLKDRFQHYCKTPEVQRYLGSGRFEGDLVGFPLNLAKFRWNGRLQRRLWGPGYLLLGDAASLIHPLSGEGIAFSIESGRIAAEVLADDRVPRERKGKVYERRVLRGVRPSFLSPKIFCAIRLPMLLPRRLSNALVASAVFAQHRFGFGIQPLRSAHIARNGPPSRSDTIDRAARSTISLEGAMLLVLFTALAAFWLVRFFDVSALPAPYGVRANFFVGIATTFCLLNARRRYGWLFTLVLFVFALASFLAIELAGASTGSVFGEYHYNSNMPGHLFGFVPIVVPFAWVVISYLAFATSVTLLPQSASVLLRAAIATVLFVAYDLVADPNHLFRGGWVYPGGGAYYGIPLQNFVAWGLLGFVGFLLLGLFDARATILSEKRSPLFLAAVAYVGVMLHEGVFALLVAGHRGAATIGFAIAAAVVAAYLGRTAGMQFSR